MGDSGRQTADWDMKMRLAADRVLRAMAVISPQRQAKLVMWASVALSVAAVVRPDVLPPDLIKLKELLNIGAISGLLARVAKDDDTLTDEDIAAEMRALLPVAQLDELATGQKDMLRVLTKQQTWQQQIELAQQHNAEAAAQLLTGLAEMGVNLVEIRETLAGVATKEQIDNLNQLILGIVLPRLAPEYRVIYIKDSQVTLNLGTNTPSNFLPDFTLPTLTTAATAGASWSSPSERLNKLPLSTDKRINLCAALARLPDFFDSSSRVSFVNTTLPHLAHTIIFDGNSQMFISALISIAEKSGFIPRDEKFHCLGAVLYYLLTFEHIPYEVKVLCANLIVEYDLVRDQAYLYELRIQYPSMGMPWERGFSGKISEIDKNYERNYTRSNQRIVRQVAQALANVQLGPSTTLIIETQQFNLRSISIKDDEE